MKNTPTPYSPYCARSFIKNIPRSVIQQVYRVSIPRNLNRRKRKRKKESQRTRANAEKPRKNRIFLSLLSIVVQTMQNLFYARLKKRGGGREIALLVQTWSRVCTWHARANRGRWRTGKCLKWYITTGSAIIFRWSNT